MYRLIATVAFGVTGLTLCYFLHKWIRKTKGQDRTKDKITLRYNHTEQRYPDKHPMTRQKHSGKCRCKAQDAYGWMSLRMSRALDDIGVSSRMIKRRRESFLRNEALETIKLRMLGDDVTCLNFGSQSEGSTTLGMKSDFDYLICHDEYNIISHLGDWDAGRTNFLMVKEETTPPQHYWLQRIRQDIPKPVRYIGQADVVHDQDGRIFIHNRIWANHYKVKFGKDFISSGPSVSATEDVDYVPAFRCKVLPPEVESWFTRSRSGKWPTKEVFQVARECSCFLVPDGHVESVNDYIEWRISPNLIERVLVFGFNIVQMKCYVTLKMLKKSVIKNQLSAKSKLTSFHCKTVMFFTMERIPLSEWKENKLLDCLQHCFQTLQMFLRKGVCPHYIITGVNLFEGKITRMDQQKLTEFLESFSYCPLFVLQKIEMDDFGRRLSLFHGNDDFVDHRLHTHESIAGIIAYDFFRTIYKTCLEIMNYPIEDILTFCLKIHDIHLTSTRYERELISIYKPFVYSMFACIASSCSLQRGKPFKTEIFQLFEIALDTDVASSRLKLASILYCKGDLLRTADVLNDVERRFDASVQSVCGCGRGVLYERPSDGFRKYAFENDYKNIVHKIAFCVRFTRMEVPCVPPFLLYEMNRALNDDIKLRTRTEHMWMEMAVVDARPYLFYLQYFTYGGLEMREKQLHAFQNLATYVMNVDNIDALYHFETALNLLGHAYEMEGDLDEALHWYTSSAEYMSENNAANWHIKRLTDTTQDRY
ncbi:uncharacterized protein LOC128222008 isoform X2 [Mya arenaria]|nr:uncharacterized protein LOC128222008 isoform X2 [Mya arenaria]XP_052786699.1 uncharacterized protein LOC128222008 isoform X2 [Mya arenaria]